MAMGEDVKEPFFTAKNLDAMMDSDKARKLFSDVFLFTRAVHEKYFPRLLDAVTRRGWYTHAPSRCVVADLLRGGISDAEATYGSGAFAPPAARERVARLHEILAELEAADEPAGDPFFTAEILDKLLDPWAARIMLGALCRHENWERAIALMSVKGWIEYSHNRDYVVECIRPCIDSTARRARYATYENDIGLLRKIVKELENYGLAL
jgi:hypothetical protein